MDSYRRNFELTRQRVICECGKSIEKVYMKEH
jgi:CDGSH-type Zn-finger protein